MIRVLDRRGRAADPDADGDASAELDPRIEARRRAVREARQARRRRRWLALSVSVTVLVAVYALSRSAAFDVDDVVVSGAARTMPEEVAARTGVRVGAPLVEVDTRAVQGAVEQLPWVDSVDVTRTWSGRVEVAVTERVAAAVLEGDGPDAALVDGTRRVLAITPSPPDELPRVRGLPAADPGAMVDDRLDGALRIHNALSPGVRTRVAAVVVTPDGYDLALRPVGTARFGTADRVEEKVLALRTLFGQVELGGVCVVDVRVPDSIGLTRDDTCG